MRVWLSVLVGGLGVVLFGGVVCDGIRCLLFVLLDFVFAVVGGGLVFGWLW